MGGTRNAFKCTSAARQSHIVSSSTSTTSAAALVIPVADTQTSPIASRPKRTIRLSVRDGRSSPLGHFLWPNSPRGARKTLPSPDETCDPQTYEEALTRSDAAQQNRTPLAGAGSRPSSKWRSTRSHVRRITRSSIGSDSNQMFTLDIEHFQRALGALTHIVLDTHPDITSTVAVLCRHAANPGFGHLYALDRLIRHLRRTGDYKLAYHPGADGGDILSGYVMLTGGTISLSLQQHGRVALSRAMVKS